MRAIKAFVLGLGVMLTACAPLQRGMVGNTYVSTADPAISIAVPDMDLRTAGQFTASVTTDESLGGIAVQSWIAVYGGTTSASPMAIVSLASLSPQYYWDSDMTRIFSINHGLAVIDDQPFQACTFISGGSQDAFAALVPTENPEKIQWIVRRFAQRYSFNAQKITLEYREPLPHNFVSLQSLPHGGVTFLHEFEQRAEKAFRIKPLTDKQVTVKREYPQGIQLRFLNTNFFGTISRYAFSVD